MSSKTLIALSGGVAIAALLTIAAQAQSSKSPFARKGKAAWETSAPTPTPATPQPRMERQAVPQPRIAQQPAPNMTPQYQTYGQAASAPAPQAATQGYQRPAEFMQASPAQSAPVQPPPQSSRGTAQTAPQPAYYPGRKSQMMQASEQGQFQQNAQSPMAPRAPRTPMNAETPQQRGALLQSQANLYGAPYGGGYAGTGAAQQLPPQANTQRPLQRPIRRAPETLSQKLGFGQFKFDIRGHLYAGVGGFDRTGADIDAETVVDGRVVAELGSITSGGLEYGISAEVRAQRDRLRRGFGGRVGDCLAADPACSSVQVAGTARPLAGHTSQFYTDGRESRKENQIALEGAYIYLRSAYGDITIGRDDGTAALFSLGAPTLVRVAASNSPVDYTGTDSVKTINDASGFAEKITYTTPRVLGDKIGFGLQAGLSYAPDARACGVDYCIQANSDDPMSAFSPDLENVIEAGLSIDRKFANGVGIELTGTYATANETQSAAVFDNLKSYGAGLNLTYGDWAFGTSLLQSNNALSDGDYFAYDAGLTWKPSKLGFTAGYGYADDDNANLTSHQGLLAISYDLGEFRLSTGAQYNSRDVPVLRALGRSSEKEKSYGLFLGGEIKF